MLDHKAGRPLLGAMQDWPLTVDKILDHARDWHGDREVVTRSVEGPMVRTTYGQIHDRAKRLSNGLKALGVTPGDRVATLAWNTSRHIETWYAAMGIGAVLLVSTSLVLALLILRRPAPGLRAPYHDAVVIGLVFTTLLGGGLGGYMSAHASHWMSAAGADTGLPLFGWSRTGGDLRPPHFLGIHAQQLIPLLALAVLAIVPVVYKWHKARQQASA